MQAPIATDLHHDLEEMALVGATGHECRRNGQDYFAGMAESTSGLDLRAIEKADVC